MKRIVLAILIVLAAAVALAQDQSGQYVHTLNPRTIQAQHTFAPPVSRPAFALGTNARSVLIPYLNSDLLDGEHLGGQLDQLLAGAGCSMTNGSATVTATSGTPFGALNVGDAVKIGGAVYTIQAKASNSAFTLDSAYAGTTATGVALYYDGTLFQVPTGDGKYYFTVSKSGIPSFSPAYATAPFTLGTNGQGQLVTGLNADKLDGSEATAFLGASGKAADADLLDGLDSLDFAKVTGANTGLKFAGSNTLEYTIDGDSFLRLQDGTTLSGNAGVTIQAGIGGSASDIALNPGPGGTVKAGGTAVSVAGHGHAQADVSGLTASSSPTFAGGTITGTWAANTVRATGGPGGYDPLYLYRAANGTNYGLGMVFQLRNSTPVDQEYAGIFSEIVSATAGSAKGRLILTVMNATRQERLRCSESGVAIMKGSDATAPLDVTGAAKISTKLDVGTDLTVSGELKGSRQNITWTHGASFTISNPNSVQYLEIGTETPAAGRGPVMPRAGSIVGYGITYDLTAQSAGSEFVQLEVVKVNGSGTTALIDQNLGSSGSFSATGNLLTETGTYARGTYPFAAGDRLVARISNNDDDSVTMANVVVFLEIQFDT